MTNMDRRAAVLAFCGSVLCGATAVGFAARKTRERTVTRGRGAHTSFGSVAVLGARQHAGVRHSGAHPVGAHHPSHGSLSHENHDPLSHENHDGWTDAVTAEVEVHNGSDRAVLVSAGQFRLRLGAHGPTVSYYDAERTVGVLGAGRTARMWISYLAPGDRTDLALEYTEAGAVRPLSTPLSVARTAAVSA
jgi:hypothetical protein